MKKHYLFIISFLFIWSSSWSQGKFMLSGGKSDKINFKLINNLIIFPVEVNGVELSFLLDTGVSKPIIFNFVNLTEELQINQTERIYLRGLGEGEPVEALRSRNNIFKIGNAINLNQDLYAVFDPNLNFSPRLGVPVHGIIGYDFLKDFIVEINYSYKYLKISNHNNYKYKKCRKCKSFDLEFHSNKPYIKGVVSQNGNNKPVKLLVDSGSSDAIWLFEDETKDITLPNKYFQDFLGHGLSGSIYGKRSKIDAFLLDDFKLRKVNVAFPDSTSIDNAKKIQDRNGSLSGGILKRFNIIFDIHNKKMRLRKNKYFSDEFYYNKSGIALEHNGIRVVRELEEKEAQIYGASVSQAAGARQIEVGKTFKYFFAPSFSIVELRKNSPAERAGLKINDVILSVNGRKAHDYSLQDIVKLFYDEDGKRIKLLIERDGEKRSFSFTLESLLK
ncbi:PDZ domain-containing protein [Flavobacteriaceae bacterium AU392]|nr:PDZ domain-containing protein [Flavobacteriaceae bacterium]RKM82908.1 PDZ domain-containing protein [Flavobacteriaceae bacterium AU392]